jgi:hypothetical protein
MLHVFIRSSQVKYVKVNSMYVSSDTSYGRGSPSTHLMIQKEYRTLHVLLCNIDNVMYGTLPNGFVVMLFFLVSCFYLRSGGNKHIL